jgi:hypothetical protein
VGCKGTGADPAGNVDMNRAGRYDDMAALAVALSGEEPG